MIIYLLTIMYLNVLSMYYMYYCIIVFLFDILAI